MQQPVHNPVHSDAIINASIRLPDGKTLAVRTMAALASRDKAERARDMQRSIDLAAISLRQALTNHLTDTEG